MKLNWLEFLNYRSYAGKQRFHFSGKDTCVIIGENGSGKSSIPGALTYCLFGEESTATSEDELSYQYDGQEKEWKVEKFGVTAGFFLNGHNYCIERMRNPKKGTLKFWDADTEADYTCNTTKETQQKIYDVIGMDYKSFVSSVVMIQEEYDDFIKMAPGQAKDVLINILGLNSYEPKRLAAAEAVKTNKEAIRVAEASVLSIQNELKVMEAIPAQLEELNKGLNENRKELTAAEKELETGQVEHQRLIKATERVSESYQNLARLQKEKSALDQSKTTEENAFDRTLAKYKIDPKELADKTLESAQRAYQNLDLRIKILEKSIGEWQQAQFAAGAQVDALRFKYTALDKKKTDSCAGGKSVCLLGRDDCNNTFLKGIEEEMVAVTLEGTTAKVKFDEAKKWTDEYSLEINSVRNSRDWWFGVCSLIPAREKIDIYSKSIRSLEGQIDISQKQIDDNDVSLDDVAAKGLEVKGVKSRIESIRQTQSGIQNEIGKLQGTLERKTGHEKSLAETMASIETKKEDVVVYEILQKAYSKDGIPALMIERLVPALEADANQFLEKLSGGSISLAFYLQKKLKQGGFSDGFEIFVTDPDGTRAIRMYSGGEKFRIIFAIHMAFSKYLSYRNGASIRCIFLDEPASSLDKKGIESFMACLASIKENYDQLFCITHMSELQEYFGDVLRVEKTATGSKIIGADDPAEKYL